MSTLLLRLAGPMQSWGTASRFAYRFTDPQPSKSAVIGLLAAAQGRRRSDPIEDLLALKFGVRCDQPGTLVRDFQTARALDESYSLPLTYRFYLGDAAFVAAIQGGDALIDGLAEALHRPAFPLYLGRRSCPPSRPVLLGVRSGTFDEVLRSVDDKAGAPWIASEWHRRRLSELVELEIVRDVVGNESPTASATDQPISFDANHRKYGNREVVREICVIDNPASRTRTPQDSSITEHDAFAAMGA